MNKNEISQVKKYFNYCFPIKNGSRVVFTVDSFTDPYVIDLLRAALNDLGCGITLLDCGISNTPYNSVPEKYYNLINSFAYWIDLTKQGSYYSKISSSFVNCGGHFLVMPGMTKEGLVKSILDADIEKVLKITQKLVSIFRSGNKLRIESDLGTKINAPILKKRISFTKVSQLLKGKNIETMLYGYGVIPIDFSKLEGVLVVNDYIWPPNSLRLLKQPITMHLKSGKIYQIQDNSYSRQLKDWLDSFQSQRVFEVAHLTYGVLANISLSDCLLMNERIAGMLTFGFGNAWDGISPTHIDMLCSGVSIWLDDICIQEKNKLVFKDLS